ncbi:sensor histidine kinase [Dyadobacter subterraneus]|uniref:Histidine kinase n=1 Tax=Dyadobacter subterraneus TaxID=2773304 RepID=A0ABR9WFZ5_9BACT|nr:histidine kinase [Dyadobacter subterraneus]MBE9464423.1 histidine kinase [Dyadobacter subterraneus]
MKNKRIEDNKDLTNKTAYFLLAAIVSVPLFLAIDAFVNALHLNEDEAISAAATGCFLAGVFFGRYCAEILMTEIKKILNIHLISLFILIIINIIWIFYHADYPFENHAALNLLMYWIPFMVVSIATGVLIKFIRFMSQNELKEAQTSAANSQSELHLLQSQLSPHFLFNTLNNLYGLSITQHEKIPPLLLRLSDLLRYSVYESNQNFVPLKDELAYIDNYIEFEKIRIGERLVLKTEIEKIDSTNIKIAPMLLIVFIENAFKHSKNTAEEKIFIDISLKTWSNYILFSIKNSHNKVAVEEGTSVNKNSGFGLVNVKKRLELLYPNESELNIEDDEIIYNVNLRLKMK